MTALNKVGAVLVVGGGIGGIQAALDLADSGFKVYIVDTSPSIGGVMPQLDKTFPTNDCSMCIVSPKLGAAGTHPNIELICSSEVTQVEGEAGDFSVTVARRYPYVMEDKCTGCGVCAEHCPIEGPNWFDEDLAPRKAIYRPFPQSVPMVYTIEGGMCIGCGECQKVCLAEAIDFRLSEEEIRKFSVGAIVLSTGSENFKAFKKREYGYGLFRNVMTSSEFERMLNASGPTGGHIIRPSDGDVPQKMAFVQCVGSRDAQLGHTYCSSMCCMAALKEAIVAQEHEPDLRSHIFFMDVRAFGKEFEDYRERAENECGVKISRNNRVAGIEENPATGNLTIRFHQETAQGTEDIVEDTFDLVVLSVGICPSEGAKKLCKKLDVRLNEHGFCWTSQFQPLETNVPGVFVCGTFQSPKDIPDTVAQGSGVASKVGSLLSEARGTLVTEFTYPDEIDVLGQEPRIGVFVCHCGTNIGGVVDVPSVVEYARTLPNVVYVEQNVCTCSPDTQKNIVERIKEYNLNRVIAAACTPRTHEPMFRKSIKEAGLNEYLFDMANIRDQCSWVHMHEPERATEKAKDLVRMSAVRAALLSPLAKQKVPVTKAGLVIGGGLAGMAASLEVAAQGFPVHIVEKDSELGGNLRGIHFLITGADPQQVLADLTKRVKENPLIRVHLNSTVEEVAGYVGNFASTLSTGEKIEHGIIIVATGGVEYRPKEYMYGQVPNVITQRQLGERLAAGNVDAKLVAIIQCVGSRNEEYPNCSRICCSTSIANAIQLKRINPDTAVYVLYKDIRTYGFNEAHYSEAAGLGIVFLRYGESEPPVVEGKDGRLLLTVKDQFLKEDIQIRPDLVVLNAATRPNPDNETLAKMLKVPLSKDGFFLEAHMKLRPVDFATEGIFLAGSAHWPKFVDEVIAQASGAATRAMTIISKEELETEGIIAAVNEDICDGCGICEPVCEYKAIQTVKVSDNPEKLKVTVNEGLCKGCGACVASCPSGAMEQKGFKSSQVIAMIDSALEGGDS